MKQKLHKLFQRLKLADCLTLCLAAGILLAAVVPAALPVRDAHASGSSPSQVDSNLGGLELSLSRFSDIIAQAWNKALTDAMTSPDALTDVYIGQTDAAGYGGGTMDFSMATVGNVFAYGDDSGEATNTSNVWTYGQDATSRSMSMETIWGLYGGVEKAIADSPMGSSDALPVSAMTKYIMFGSLLNYMGVDEFRDATSTSNGLRFLTGYAMYGLFIIAYSACGIMGAVVEFLQKTNIFAIFSGAIGSTMTTLLATLAGRSSNPGQFEQAVGGILDTLQTFRFVILFFMIMGLVWIAVVWKSKSYGQAANIQNKSRRILYRFVIMVIGIPIVGMIYTECLNLVGNIETDTKYVITDYVLQEFMDFEKWTVGSFGSTADGSVTDSDGTTFTTSDTQPYNTAFRVSDDDFAGLDNGAGQYLSMRYSSKAQSFEVRSEKNTSSTLGGAETSAFDIGQFVAAVNNTNYPGVIDPLHVGGSASIFGSSRSTESEVTDALNSGESVFSQFTGDAETVNPGGTWTDYVNDTTNDDAEAYDLARRLILNYAQSATVSPDVLNDVFLTDIQDLSSIMLTPDSVESGQFSTVNATAMEQLFGVNAADQRIWSYIQVKENPDKWVYPSDKDPRDISLYDAGGASIKIHLEGFPISAGVKVVTSEGTTYAMRRTLMQFTRDATKAQVNLFDSQNNTMPENSSSINTFGMNNGGSRYVTDGNDAYFEYYYGYNLNHGGISALSMYNYLHSKFENGVIYVYSPRHITNAGVGTMHYSVTLPYTGIAELVNLLYLAAVLFALGALGWIFGISLFMNCLIEIVKAIPSIFKMMIGSIQGFVEGLLTVFSIAVEMVVTLFFYTQSVNILDFLIVMVRQIALKVLSIFGGDAVFGVDPETYAIVSGLITAGLILWGCFELIKWRKAIVMSIKSILTHALNAVFGTSAAMPTGASSGMLKAGAAVAAGGMVLGSLAGENGTLEDVVNDLTGSDLGSSVKDKLADGDYEGAMDDVRDFASGDYRGRSETSDAAAVLGGGEDGISGANGWQSLTDEQKGELQDEFGDDLQKALDEADAAAEEYDSLKKSGASAKELEKAKAKKDDAEKNYEDLMQKRSEKAAKMRQTNFDKARALGVADYGDYLREEGMSEEEAGNLPTRQVDPAADLPEDPGQELDRDGQATYDAAREGDAETLRAAAKKYDSNGLTAEQRAAVNDMVVNGASEEEIAQAVDRMAEENFGENHGEVVDKMNEAASRASKETYGSFDNSEGRARTMDVGMSGDEDGSYSVKDHSSSSGAKTIRSSGGPVFDKNGEPVPEVAPADLPKTPDTEDGGKLGTREQQLYEAAREGDARTLQALGENYDENGLTKSQQAEVRRMLAGGASASEVAARVGEMAEENFGSDYQKVVDKMNEAKGQDNLGTYEAQNAATGEMESVSVGFDSDGSTIAVDNNAFDALTGVNTISSGSGSGQGQASMMSRRSVMSADDARTRYAQQLEEQQNGGGSRTAQSVGVTGGGGGGSGAQDEVVETGGSRDAAGAMMAGVMLGAALDGNDSSAAAAVNTVSANGSAQMIRASAVAAGQNRQIQADITRGQDMYTVTGGSSGGGGGSATVQAGGGNGSDVTVQAGQSTDNVTVQGSAGAANVSYAGQGGQVTVGAQGDVRGYAAAAGGGNATVQGQGMDNVTVQGGGANVSYAGQGGQVSASGDARGYTAAGGGGNVTVQGQNADSVTVQGGGAANVTYAGGGSTDVGGQVRGGREYTAFGSTSSVQGGTDTVNVQGGGADYGAGNVRGDTRGAAYAAAGPVYAAGAAGPVYAQAAAGSVYAQGAGAAGPVIITGAADGGGAAAGITYEPAGTVSHSAARDSGGWSGGGDGSGGGTTQNITQQTVVSGGSGGGYIPPPPAAANLDGTGGYSGSAVERDIWSETPTAPPTVDTGGSSVRYEEIQRMIQGQRSAAAGQDPGYASMFVPLSMDDVDDGSGSSSGGPAGYTPTTVAFSAQGGARSVEEALDDEDGSSGYVHGRDRYMGAGSADDDDDSSGS